jgi:hypothetical protein
MQLVYLVTSYRKPFKLCSCTSGAAGVLPLTLVILGMGPVPRSGGLSAPPALPLTEPPEKLVLTSRPLGVLLPVARGVLLPAAPAELRLLRLLALLDLDSPGDAGEEGCNRGVFFLISTLVSSGLGQNLLSALPCNRTSKHQGKMHEDGVEVSVHSCQHCY